MSDTKTLIDRLSGEAGITGPLRSPAYWGKRLVAVLGVYAIGIQYVLGLRPDIFMQFTRPLFAAELLLLITLLLASIFACVLSMYPDAYQKTRFLKAPYIVFILLVGLVCVQIFLPPDSRMVMPLPGAHGMECAICIASVALIPSALIFALMRKGATVLQFRAGSFAVLAASAVGCLTLRLAEANDSMLHLASWHYAPTILFAAMGAYMGRWLLKW